MRADASAPCNYRGTTATGENRRQSSSSRQAPSPAQTRISKVTISFPFRQNFLHHQPPPPLHLTQIQAKREHFFAKRVENCFQILYLCQIKAPAGYEITHDTMRTDAMVAILMVRYLKAHDNRMNAIIEAKMGHSESITNPQMIDLEGLMKAYLPKGFVVGTNYQLDLCAKIFENSLSKIEFDITD